MGVESGIPGEAPPHLEQRRRAALERVGAEQDRDAAMAVPPARQLAIHALGASGVGARRSLECGADLRRQRDLQEFVIEDVVHERRERHAHAARLVGGQRRVGPSDVGEVIEARGDSVADHLGGAEQHGQANRLGAERPAVGHRVERPRLERQAVLGPLQERAVGVIVRVDQAGHQDHPGRVDHLARPRPHVPLLAVRERNRGDRAPLDEHAPRARLVARLETHQSRVGEVDARRAGGGSAHAVSDGYQCRLPALARRASHPARIRTAVFAVRTACSIPP